MQFWHGPIVDLLWILGLMGAVGLVWRQIPALSRFALPVSMASGVLAFVLGPSVAAVIPFSTSTLEVVVYHGLALLFAAFGLMPVAGGARRAGAKSMIMAIPIVGVAQGVVGLAIVLLFTLAGDPLHPGFGQALPLAFSQGPGQALAIGRSWEGAGMVNGGQIGLTMAAIGYLWCCLVGVPLVHFGRRRGWATPIEDSATAADDLDTVASRPGDLHPLALHVGLIALVYVATYLIISALAAQVAASKPRIATLMWGFHFLIAVFLAIFVRRVVIRFGRAPILSRAVLTRISGFLVDLVTCCAIAAISLEVVGEHLAPILIITTVGGTATLFFCLWMARRAFPDDPFSHTLALFGTATGTLPTGLALLRVHDPELKSEAASNLVVGAAGAIVPGLPVLLLILPMPIVGWPESFPGAVYETMALQLAFIIAFFVVWRLFLGFRFRRPLRRLWPSGD